MKPLRSARIGLVVVLAATLAAPLLLDGSGALREAAAFPAQGTLAVLAAVCAGWMAKAVKFRLLAARLGEPLRFAPCLAVSLGCDCAFLASPAGLAGYPATVFLFGRVGVGASCAAAIAAADQILDLVFFSAAMPLALVWLIANESPGLAGVAAPRIVWAGLGVLAGIAAIAWLVRAYGLQWLRRSTFAGMPALRRLCAELADHLRALAKSPPRFVSAIALATAAQWFARYASLGIAIAWLGHAMPPAAVFLAQAVALHAGQWTGLPGGIGAADGILFEALRPWIASASAATAIVVWRLASFHLTLLTGGAAFALLGMRGPRFRPALPAIATSRPGQSR